VECGSPPTYSQSAVQGGRSGMQDFDSKALLYHCSAGYSTSSSDSPYTPANANFTLVCNSVGVFPDPLACVNINDCN
jgi:hypothetical protein